MYNGSALAPGRAQLPPSCQRQSRGSGGGEPGWEAWLPSRESPSLWLAQGGLCGLAFRHLAASNDWERVGGCLALRGEQSILWRGGEGKGTHTLEQRALSAKVVWLRQVDAAGRCRAIAPFLFLF